MEPEKNTLVVDNLETSLSTATSGVSDSEASSSVPEQEAAASDSDR